MINKKILLSLLTIGLLACVASAGTWAYFKDTVTSADNIIKTATLTSEYSLDEGTNWIPFSGESEVFGPFCVYNIVPDSTEYTVQSIGIHNMGNTSASVDAVVTPGTTYDSVPDLVITVGGQTIYEDGDFVTDPVILDLGDVSPAGAGPADASIKYTYTNNGNQNDYETLNIPFNMSISETAIHTP